MDVSEGSVDVIFSNWLLMYLSDNEVSFVYFRAHIQNFHSFFLSFQFRHFEVSIMYDCMNRGVMAHGSN